MPPAVTPSADIPPGAAAGAAAWPADRFVGRASALKLGLWVFILSDAFSFAGLLLAYGVLRAAAATWWVTGEPPLGIGFTAGLTFLLICSSVTMVLAVWAARVGDRRQTVLYLGLTALGGLLFLAGQFHEYFGIVGEGLSGAGLTFGKSHRATTFYAITAFHGAHVATGVLLLLLSTVRAARNPDPQGEADRVESVGLFWHFVDLVWILVFTFVYLLPSAPGA